MISLEYHFRSTKRVKSLFKDFNGLNCFFFSTSPKLFPSYGVLRTEIVYHAKVLSSNPCLEGLAVMRNMTGLKLHVGLICTENLQSYFPLLLSFS